MSIQPINKTIQTDRFLNKLNTNTLQADLETQLAFERSIPAPEHIHHQSIEESQRNAVEEISMAFSEKMEFFSKAHSSKFKQHRNKSIFRINMLEELYGLLGNRPDSDLEKNIEKILKYQNALTLEDLLGEADNDPTKADIILSLAASKDTLNEQQRAHFQVISEELQQQFGQEIRAGVNTAKALATFSKDPNQRHSMRNLYYSAIVGRCSVHAVYDALLSTFDEIHFNQGITALLAAMNADLSAQIPSLPHSQLRLLLKDLKASQQLSHIYGSCRRLLEKMQNKHFTGHLSVLSLTKKMLDMTQSNVFPRDIRKLASEAVGTNNANAHLLFLNTFKPVVDKLPLSIWKGNQAREAMLNLITKIMEGYAKQEQQERALSMKKQISSLY